MVGGRVVVVGVVGGSRGCHCAHQRAKVGLGPIEAVLEDDQVGHVLERLAAAQGAVARPCCILELAPVAVAVAVAVRRDRCRDGGGGGGLDAHLRLASSPCSGFADGVGDLDFRRRIMATLASWGVALLCFSRHVKI